MGVHLFFTCLCAGSADVGGAKEGKDATWKGKGWVGPNRELPQSQIFLC